MTIQSFRDLDVWRKAMDLTEQTYRLVAQFPSDERYGLSLQLRRGTVSIPSNIAEGQGFGTIAQLLKFATAKQVAPLMDSASQIGRMLNGLIGSLSVSQTGDDELDLIRRYS